MIFLPPYCELSIFVTVSVIFLDEMVKSAVIRILFICFYILTIEFKNIVTPVCERWDSLIHHFLYGVATINLIPIQFLRQHGLQ
jgi:hypothetical protein